MVQDEADRSKCRGAKLVCAVLRTRYAGEGMRVKRRTTLEMSCATKPREELWRKVASESRLFMR